MVDIVTRLGKGSPLTNAEVDANFTNLAEVSGVTGEPMGHEDRTTSTISFNASTRTFTIAPTASSFTVWCKGKKVVVSSARTVTIPNTTGMYSIYFDSTGTLAAKSGYFTFAEEAPTAYIYWNATTGTAPYFGDERHGVVLDWQTHEYLHRTRGAALASGFSASGYVLGGSGSLNSHAQLTLEGGTFFDEDMKIIVTATNTPTAGTWEQDLTSPARIPVLHLQGTAWVMDSPTDYPLKQGTSRPQYNAYSGGVWSTADVANNKYSTTWVLATNNLTYPVIAIIGQAESDSQSTAEAVDFTELQLPGFPSVEFRPLYKLIFQCADSCTNAVHASLVSITDIRSIAAAGTAASIVTDHGNLSGLSDDDHPQYLSVDTVRGSLTAAVKASFLPSQTSNAGKFLQTDGTATSWQALTSGNVTTALGFTPYNATNPSGFITGITSGNVTTALGFTPYNATNPSGYVNAAGARGAISVTGAGSYDSATGVINIVGGVTSFNTRTGAITLSSSDVTTALGFTPYNSTNPNGYLTGITSTQVTTALGYTPYNSSNPSGYITGITSGMVTTALGFTPYNNSNPSGYITSAALSPYLTTASAASTYLALSGGTMTGIINMAGTQTITTAGYAGIEYYNAAGTWQGYIGTENNAGNLRYNARLGTHTWYANSTSIGAWDASSLRVSGSVLTTTGASSWGVYSNTNGSNYSGIWFSTNVGELLLRTADGSLSTRIAADGSFAFINNNNILHAGNYNSYSPTLTGTGASGTWGISISGNSATTSQRAFSGDISSTGQGRFTGWYTGNAATGPATEVGLAGGEGYILSYNRSTSAYVPLNIAASAANMQFSGSTINVTSGSLQQGGNQVLHAGNYNSYAPTLTGGGASGTWGISISGNAATATSADQIDGIGFRNTASNFGTNADTIESNGITYYTAGVPNFTGNAADGALYSQAYSSAWQHQIAGDYRSGQIALRGKNSGTWQSWRTVLDSSNYISYALPLSGGILSGAIRAPQITAGGSTYTDANLGVQGSSHLTGTIYYGGTVGNVNSWSSISSSSAGTHTFSGSRFIFDRYGYGSQALIDLQNGLITLSQPTVISGNNTLDFGPNSTWGATLRVGGNGHSGSSRASVVTTNGNLHLDGGGSGTGIYLNYYTSGPIYATSGLHNVIHAGNYSSYALPLSGGTLTGLLTLTGAAHNYLYINPGNGYEAMVRYNGGSGSGWYVGKRVTSQTVGTESFHFYSEAASKTVAGIDTGGNIIATGNLVSNGNTIKQGNDLARPLASWGAGGDNTGMVIFKLPGSSGNYGMVHMVFDIYEYNSNSVSTVIVGGHNWASSWYNTGANVIGQLGKQVRLGYKDGQYCVVFGDSSSTWSYGQIVFRKIQNGAYYTNIMDLGAAISVQFTSTESFTNIGGDLRALRTPASFNAGGAITQAGNQVLHAGNYTSYSPSLGGSGASGTWGISISGSAAQLGGYGPNQTGGANTIVQRDSNGYIQNSYFYTSGGGSERNGSGLGYFAGYNSSDYYIRSYTAAAAAAAMGALTTSNYSSYALPLSGGTMSGAIRTPTNTGIFIGSGVTTSDALRINWHTDGDLSYFIGKRAGTWTQPMDISFYTGLRYHAHNSYGGHRWYTTGIDSNMSFSVGDGDNNVRVTNTLYSYAYRGNGNVAGTGEAVYAPAGVYSTGTNWLYGQIITNGNTINASGATCTLTATRANRANGNFYIDDNYGCGIVGAYASTRYQGVFAMGDSYKLPADGTTAGNLYGIAWSYPSAGGVAGNLDSHGMLVLINGGFGSCMSYSIKASSNVTAYSDERLKTNWRDMPENYVARLAQVKVGIYDRIDGEKITQVGVGAQSLQELLPQAIETAKDEIGTLSVAYGNAALASAVELAKDNVELRARIERLESLINKLIGD